MDDRILVANGGTLMQELSSGPNPDPGAPAIQPGGQKDEDAEVCISNISPRERFKRLIGGVIPFVIALSILSWLIWADASRLWRAPLFLLFVAAATGYFQWRDKT